MNILIMSWRGPGHPHAGGAEESTHQHAKGWVMAGHRVKLFTSGYPGAKKEDTIDGVRIIRQGSQTFGVHVSAFKWFMFDNKEKYDIVIDQFHGIPFFTPLYIKEKKLAFIHEVTKEVWRLNSWSWPFNIIPFVVGTVFEPLVFRLFYRGIPFFTVSESTKKELTEWGIPNKNVTVIYNGSDASGIKKIPPKDKKKAIMFLGALSKDKGIEDALKTFSILNCGNEEYNFWVVGKGELHYLNYLKRLTKNLGIDKKVKFWGFVSETKKFELLARASILINPSIREGWGLVVIEAASVGTPTVGYNVAGLRDSIIDQRTGFISETTPKALSEKLVVLLQNKLLYRKMSVNCIKWAKSFNWRKSARQSLKLLEDLAEEDK